MSLYGIGAETSGDAYRLVVHKVTIDLIGS